MGFDLANITLCFAGLPEYIHLTSFSLMFLSMHLIVAFVSFLIAYSVLSSPSHPVEINPF